MVEKPIPNHIFVRGEKKGFGYRRSLNSIKDYYIDHPKVEPLMQKIQFPPTELKKIQKNVDFRNDMTPIRDQGSLGSCTAFAVSGLVEYFEKKTYKKYSPISTLFTYKATRNLMRETGDVGAYMRSVMGSIALFGSPPEEYWEYEIKKFDEEPPAFCYAFGSNFQSTKYIRLDHPNATGENTIRLLKQFLSRKIPVMFGFTVFESFREADIDGQIPFPSASEEILGGHAVVMCGYDDDMVITGSSTATTGAFIIRNSWGEEWGEAGYGYLPYEYFLQNKLADDCWTLLSSEWLDHVVFL